MGILYSTERGFLESALQSGFGVSGGEILQAPTEFRISGGVNLSDGVAFTLGTMQTLIGPKRNPWVVDLGLTMMFGSETDGVNSAEQRVYDHHHQKPGAGNAALEGGQSQRLQDGQNDDGVPHQHDHDHDHHHHDDDHHPH